MEKELDIEQLKFAREIGAVFCVNVGCKNFHNGALGKDGFVYRKGKWIPWVTGNTPGVIYDVVSFPENRFEIDFSPLDDYKQDKDFDIAATGGEVVVPVKMSHKYPAYFKDFSGDDEADVYLIHHKFGIDDPSGCIHHASKKLLLSGIRTGGKSKYQDVKEAHDTLNRWLEINKDLAE